LSIYLNTETTNYDEIWYTSHALNVIACINCEDNDSAHSW